MNFRKGYHGRFIKADPLTEPIFCPTCGKPIKRNGVYVRDKVCRHCIFIQNRDKNIDKVLDAYGHKCTCCGETTRLFLTVDHINNDGHKQKRWGVKLGGVALYRWLIKNNFPKEYQILCYNCNCGKFRNKGICPHKGETK